MGQEDTQYKLVRRKYQPKDYEIYKEWWEYFKSKPPHPRYLPETGLVIEVNNIPVCLGFLYHTDSKICMFEHYICNPKAEKELRDKGLNYLIDSVIEWKNKSEYDMIYTSINNKKFISRLEERGFLKGDDRQTHMFYGEK